MKLKGTFLLNVGIGSNNVHEDPSFICYLFVYQNCIYSFTFMKSLFYGYTLGKVLGIQRDEGFVTRTK